MKKVIAYVHSHWDREWYREFEEFRLRLIEVFDEVITALKKGDLPVFYFDGQTSALEDYLEIKPEKETEIKKLIKAKKLRIGPFYCSSDSFLVSGESLCRNLQIGIEKSKELGETEFIGYLSDTFGHSESICKILKHFDIDKACLWRGLGDLPADLNWNGIEVTYLIQGYFQDFLNSDLSIEKKAELLKKYLDKISLKSNDNVLLPIGADHLCIPKNINKQIEELNKIYSDYKVELATPFEYFEKIKDRKKVKGEFLDNSLNFILPGVYSSRLDIKQANANSQWLLTRIAEPLQAIFGTNKQNEINYAYKELIKNHAHDSIYGCSLDEVHMQNLARYQKVDCISNGIIKRTLRDISSEKGDLSVINLSNFEYNGVIKIKTEKKLSKEFNAIKLTSKKGFTDKKLYNINEIPITEDITTINEYLIDVKNMPAFSINKVNAKNICRENYLKYTENSIENNNIKFEIKNGKVIVTDKKKNEKYSDFIQIIDRADIGDSYNFAALKGDKKLNAKILKYKIKEQNHIRLILNIIFEVDIPAISTEKGRSKKALKHKNNIDVILYNQADYLEFDAKWENKSKNHILQIGFNLKDKITSTINEDLFGTIERKFNPDFDLYKEIPAPRGKELKPNTAPMQRFVISQNLGVITKGLTEYEVSKNTLFITLLRATGIISNPKNTTRGTPAGPPLNTPDLQRIGENKANFAITFNNKEDDLFKLSEYFYYPCEVAFTEIKDKKFFDLDKNQLLYSVQKTKQGLALRIYDKKEEKIITLLK